MIQIRRMIREDIAHGMRLKEQAAWNQVEPDWQRLFDLQPDGGFVATFDGKPIGTVTTCRFGPVAWIAMMLVDENYRGQGIGRRLMVRALEDLACHEVCSVRLDATPLGRPLYESLGFIPETTFVRFAGIVHPAVGAVELPAGKLQGRDHQLIALDREVTGTDRGKLISRLIADHGDSLRVLEDNRDVVGFLMSRPGSRARQIGPCIANEWSGRQLLADASRRYAGESVVIDIPARHNQALTMGETLGLKPARQLLRMGRGPRIAEDLSRLWASAGPEKG
ncbi:Acetyltransferase (GNAT) domain-containing protein [Singulisphaera sp. GP187]|uniref:GNAT family N-acetyltransferase n=1 Tax=Singulisphaera sp. GP187 TaxID=1882752 RepID=UPI000927DBEB|nr:GNAT family N-acetyltransferase [Singulisphaera sp. GP187]SIO61800.1 Acetyltransferase (GNAT) domain-containing protein [Singulisphaera sp. GP187]